MTSVTVFISIPTCYATGDPKDHDEPSAAHTLRCNAVNRNVMGSKLGEDGLGLDVRVGAIGVAALDGVSRAPTIARSQPGELSHLPEPFPAASSGTRPPETPRQAELGRGAAAAFACAGSEGRATSGAGQRAGLAVRRLAGGRRPPAGRSRDGAQESPARSVTARARRAATGALLALVAFLVVPMTAQAQSTDATLSDLTLSDGTLNPAFAPATLIYTAAVAESVSQITVTPTPNDSNATVAYLDGSDSALTDAHTDTGFQVALNVGANTIKVKVTAEDTTTTRTYTVEVTRDALRALTLRDGVNIVSLQPNFASTIQSYTASVPAGVTRVTVRASLEGGASVGYLDASDMTLTDADRHTQEQQVNLAEGQNRFKLKVTTGTINKTYTITVNRSSMPGAPNTGANADGSEIVWGANVALAKTRLPLGGEVLEVFTGFSETFGTVDGFGDGKPRTFNAGGASYTVAGLYQRTRLVGLSQHANEMTFWSSPAFPTGDEARYVLDVNGTTFEVGEATQSNLVYKWTWRTVTGWARHSVVPVTLTRLNAPAVPGGLQATAGVGEVTLEWTTPAKNGGRPITGYQYRRQKGTEAFGSWTDIANSDASTTSATLAMLENAVAHTFEVRAKNAIGESPAASVMVTPGKIPDAPTALEATAGDGEVTLSWTTSESDGGTPITKHQYCEKTDSTACAEGDWEDIADSAADGANATGITLANRTNGTTYTYQVRAVNALGGSTASNEVPARPLPPMATITEVAIATSTPSAGFHATGNQIDLTVTFDATVRTSAAKPTLKLTVGNETRTAAYHAGDNTATLTFRYTVHGDDRDTDGEIGVPINAVGLPTGSTRITDVFDQDVDRAHAATTFSGHKVNPTPAAPPELTAQIVSSGLALSWEEAEDHGFSITGYQRQHRREDESSFGAWSAIPDSAPGETNETRYTVLPAGLDPGKVYVFRVRAVNAAGAGAPSNPASGRTRAIPPTEPESLEVQLQQGADTVGVGNGTVWLLFHPPADDGGALVRYQWRFEEDLQAFGPWMDIDDSKLISWGGGRLGYFVTDAGITTMNHRDRGVPKGYIFQVRALNSAGAGPRIPAAFTPSTYWFELTTRRWTPTQTQEGFEEGSEVRFSVRAQTMPHRACPFSRPFNVTWTATDPGGYITGDGTGTRTFAACQLVKTFAIETVDDAENEPEDGNVTVSLSSVTVTKASEDENVPDQEIDMRTGDPAPAVTFTVRDNDDFGAPRSLKARRGDGEVGLEWETPSSQDGGTLLRYQVRHRTDRGAFGAWHDILNSQAGGANAKSWAVIDLDNGKHYTFEVRAQRALGNGATARVSQTPEEARWHFSRSRSSVVEGETMTLTIGTTNGVGFYSAPEPLTLEVIGRTVLPDAPEFANTGADPEDYRISVNGAEVTGDRATFAGDGEPFEVRHFDVEVPVGATSLAVAVQALHDDEDENQEVISWHVYRGDENEWINRSMSDGQNTLNINRRQQEELSKQVSVADAEATEGEDPALDFVVSLAPAAPFTVKVDYATADGTATAGADYAATSGTLTFAPNETKMTISVPVLDDDIEDTPETLTLTLSNPSPKYPGTGPLNAGTHISDTEAIGTIRNSEDGAEPSTLSVADAETAEAEGETLDFVVTLDPAAAGTVTVDYATADGTATAGDDYTAASGTLTFEEGETTKTVTVAVVPDTVNENLETVTLTLSNAAGADLSDAAATGTIRDADAAARDALTASFEGVPAAHDGQSQFTFELRFSEAPKVSYRTLQDGAVEVAGGAVRGARRLQQGSNQRWEITVEPDADGAVTIELPATSDCEAAGAICTEDGRRLSNSPSATVAGPPSDPLTASFSGMPVEHTGEAFTFGLTFSEEPKLGYRTLRDVAMQVTGGTARKAQRRQQGSNQGWNITIQPDGDGTVRIRLPETTTCGASGAICTGDGRPLSHALTAPVAGPVGIAVADARVEEDEGAVLAFVVTLSRPASGSVRVDYATADRQRAGGGGLHGGERDADVPVGRVVKDDRGRGARRRARRGRGDADAHAVERGARAADGRRGDGHDHEPGPAAAGALGAVRADGGRARGRARRGPVAGRRGCRGLRAGSRAGTCGRGWRASWRSPC